MIRTPQFAGKITVRLMDENKNGGFNVGPLRDNHQSILTEVKDSTGANVTYKAGQPTRSHAQFDDGGNRKAQEAIIWKLMQLGVQSDSLDVTA